MSAGDGHRAEQSIEMDGGIGVNDERGELTSVEGIKNSRLIARLDTPN